MSPGEPTIRTEDNMTAPRTSETHPINVDWLATPWTGRVGLTFAPGKKDRFAATGAWDRDLSTDLDRLRRAFGVAHLVSLIEDHELELLQIQGLVEEATLAGLAVRRFPVRDVSTPVSTSDVRVLVREIVQWAETGENVVIHCRGGLGRAGTIGGCVLRAAGLDGETALAQLNAARGPNCPETAGQRDFVRSFSLA
jgi:protein-tyrosine phosphatase